MHEIRQNCPWDKIQTHDSLRQYLLEETYEVLEALDDRNYSELKIELGDLLLQVFFHAELAREKGLFDLGDILFEISDKLVRRHPHVFGNEEANSPEKVRANWEQIKLKEGRKSVLEGVPKELPSLLRAYRLTSKASKVGFDWNSPEGAFEKLEEEIHELKDEMKVGNKEKMEEELGDMLFALVNFSRFYDINPEDALRKTTAKFIRRFTHVEETLQKNGKLPQDSTLEEMDKIWDEAKRLGL
ncbi:MAG: nucleoside triphosphate pyrophosphohydrolase [Calditrichaeota bacterium]|nr:MAG: nucleoside triphosphate pyrophosphohydrolase [Calditrichota bacterium]